MIRKKEGYKEQVWYLNDSTKTPEVKNVCNNVNLTYSRITETNI